MTNLVLVNLVWLVSQKCLILDSYGVGIRNVKHVRNTTRAVFFFSLVFSLKEGLMPDWFCF